MKQFRKKRLVWSILLLFLPVAAFVWYVNDYYHSDESVQQYLQGNELVQIKDIDDGLWIDGPGTEKALVFYPGAKVEFTAYVPLRVQLAETGMDIFLIKMPCNLAFLGKNKADDILMSYDYRRWYLGGHSLGGAMAAAYSSEHLQELSGLVLLAAYPTASLEADVLTVVSIYGSEDDVLNMEKVKQGREYMPNTYAEVCIQGGNHAQFGNYGLQKKDGTPLISREEQQKQTVNAICQNID